MHVQYRAGRNSGKQIAFLQIFSCNCIVLNVYSETDVNLLDTDAMECLDWEGVFIPLTAKTLFPLPFRVNAFLFQPFLSKCLFLLSPPHRSQKCELGSPSVPMHIIPISFFPFSSVFFPFLFPLRLRSRTLKFQLGALLTQRKPQPKSNLLYYSIKYDMSI